MGAFKFVEIQEYLRGLVEESYNEVFEKTLSSDLLYFSLREEAHYRRDLWASILLKNGKIDSEKREHGGINKSGSKYVITKQKGEVTIPVEVSLAAKSKEDAQKWMNIFYAKLSDEIVLDTECVRVEPQKPTMYDKSLTKNAYYFALEIDFVHGIFISQEKGSIPSFSHDVSLG